MKKKKFFLNRSKNIYIFCKKKKKYVYILKYVYINFIYLTLSFFMEKYTCIESSYTSECDIITKSNQKVLKTNHLPNKL